MLEAKLSSSGSSDSSGVVGRRRRLQSSSRIVIDVSVPLNATGSLEANATAAAELADRITSALSSALGANVSVAEPMVSSTFVTIQIELLGAVSDAQAASASTLASSVVTSSLASSLGVAESALSVSEPAFIFPPRPPPASPPSQPPVPPSPPSRPPSPPPLPPPTTEFVTVEPPTDGTSKPADNGTAVGVRVTAFYRTSNGSLSAFWVAGHSGFPFRGSHREPEATDDAPIMQSVIDARGYDDHVLAVNPAATSGVQTPFRYVVGDDAPWRRVVDGWDRASVGMRQGERRWAVVPPAEGYRSAGFPAFGSLSKTFETVPRDSTIIFDFRCIYVE